MKSVRKTTHPSSYDLYDIFCAVLYLLKEGCTWRAIPNDYPKWTAVRYHYDNWAKEDENGISILDKILHKLIEAERKENEREEKTTMIIIDSKTIQNADTAEVKGYDGIKLHIGVDVLGLPHAIMLTAANATDRNGAIDMVDYYYEKSSKCVIISPKQSISPHFLKIATPNYYLFTTVD